MHVCITNILGFRKNILQSEGLEATLASDLLPFLFPAAQRSLRSENSFPSNVAMKAKLLSLNIPTIVLHSTVQEEIL